MDFVLIKTFNEAALRAASRQAAAQPASERARIKNCPKMVSKDVFDRFDQYSNLEIQVKLKKYKFQSISSFIETYLNKYYEVYKKNKNSDISFSDYRKLMLKELAIHRNQKSKSRY